MKQLKGDEKQRHYENSTTAISRQKQQKSDAKQQKGDTKKLKRRFETAELRTTKPR